MKKITKPLSLLMALLLAVSLFSGCLEDENEGYEDYEEDYEEEYEEDEQDYSLLNPEGLKMNSVLSVDKNTGEMTINRPKHDPETPMGEEGVWTIFVYICGSNLESEGGDGTEDINEMLSADASDNVRFVIETGGASEWQNDYVSADVLQRFVVQNGEITEVGSVENASMGNSNTLTDFLRWGITEYPSEHMGFVFWNHGGGSITGVCYDENFDDDSLSLIEIDSALYSVFDEMTDSFEFIGFDACLMSTVETANILASYARYMYASEELEPGSGWDYTAIGSFLAENPDADGAELGRAVCDSYLALCESVDQGDQSTLSVVDLGNLDNLLIAFNRFSKSMFESGDDADSLSGMIRGIKGAENFGGNDDEEGYTNMVDLSGIVDACSGYSSGADEVKKALDNAVAYKVAGSDHANAGGLSMYYPLKVGGSKELAFFETVAVSPYYMSFIDRQNHGAANVGDSYDDSYYFDENSSWNSGGDYVYDEQSGNYVSEEPSGSYYEYADQIETTGESSYITFESEPAINENGIYTFTLTSEGLDNTSAVYAIVYQITEDGNNYFELGETFDIVEDWETGVFEDCFDGYWMSLPDGQNLALYIVDYDENCTIYTSPIMLNGKETNLRIRHDIGGDVTIEGAWDGIDENGAASRDIVKLKDGDVIVPLYTFINGETYEDEGKYQGREYTVKGTPEIIYGLLEPADYLYAFDIEDIYYDYYLTDFVTFNVDENGETSFYEE